MEIMTVKEAIESRHSIRQYLDTPIPEPIVSELNKDIANYNAVGDLNIQLVTGEEKAFGGLMSRYGKFTGVKNYFALIGKKADNLYERIGYYGEKLVLKAQMLGLNTCWVALTYSKKKCPVTIGNGEKLICVIALGYGATQGKERKSKPIADLYRAPEGDIPEWFLSGVKSAMKAPTAVNQQQFTFVLDGNSVSARAKLGFYSEIDLGIVKYHFEIGAGVENFVWKKD